MAVSGRLIAAGGHLHDFGKEVRLEDVATGKVLAQVNACRTPGGQVTGVSHGLYGILGRGPHLVAGRQYRLVAVYEESPKDSIPRRDGTDGWLTPKERIVALLGHGEHLPAPMGSATSCFLSQIVMLVRSLFAESVGR